MDQFDVPTYRCTVSDMEEFKRSKIWLDILGELERWLLDVHQEFEDLEAPERILRNLQGNAQAFKRFATIPDRIIQNIEDVKLMKEEGGISDE